MAADDLPFSLFCESISIGSCPQPIFFGPFHPRVSLVSLNQNWAVMTQSDKLLPLWRPNLCSFVKAMPGQLPQVDQCNLQSYFPFFSCFLAWFSDLFPIWASFNNSWYDPSSSFGKWHFSLEQHTDHVKKNGNLHDAIINAFKSFLP